MPQPAEGGRGVPPQRNLDPMLIQRWKQAGGHLAQIDPRGCPANPSSSARWKDFTGVLLPQAAPVGWAAIVRPDKTVMHDGPIEEMHRLVEASMVRLGSAHA